uniref:Putative ovule protein n=1 Tax=Solanum chacoense TaxID=4108 RepID=A0A0V0GY56_SOLCH
MEIVYCLHGVLFQGPPTFLEETHCKVVWIQSFVTITLFDSTQYLSFSEWPLQPLLIFLGYSRTVSNLKSRPPAFYKTA